MSQLLLFMFLFLIHVDAKNGVCVCVYVLVLHVLAHEQRIEWKMVEQLEIQYHDNMNFVWAQLWFESDFDT